MRKVGLRLTIVIAIILVFCYFLYPTIQLALLSPDTRATNPDLVASLKKRALKLGLDLQGGMHLVMEIDTTKLPPDVVTPPIDESIEVIRSRVDQFGVTEPVIQKVGNKRIIVDLPGIQNLEAAKELLQETALLEFKLVRSPEEVAAFVRDVDKLLTDHPELMHISSQSDSITVAKMDSSSADSATQKTITGKKVEDTTKVAKALDSTAVAEAGSTMSASEIFGGESSSVENPPLEEEGVESPFSSLLDVDGDMILVSLSDKEMVERIISLPAVQKALPRGSQLLWGSKNSEYAGRVYRPLYLVNAKTELTGDKLATASFGLGTGGDPRTAGKPIVNLKFTDKGKKIFSRVTGANINRKLAIVLNNRVYTDPVIKTKIRGGNAEITGIQSLDEAKIISIVLKAGSLPAPLQIIEERAIGPSLGQDSIRRGIISAIIGFILVLIFMLIYYRSAGFIADFALFLNLIILIGTMAILKATLTLPGVAGVILTIGMSVDANVLIFSRIREELYAGKSPVAAMDAGYSRAFRTILDANLTTLITAAILYYFGTGPIKGFAVTLSLGIIISFFTAIFVTRVVFDMIISRGSAKKLSI